MYTTSIAAAFKLGNQRVSPLPFACSVFFFSDRLVGAPFVSAYEFSIGTALCRIATAASCRFMMKRQVTLPCWLLQLQTRTFTAGVRTLAPVRLLILNKPRGFGCLTDEIAGSP